jgi:hypothetical protein
MTNETELQNAITAFWSTVASGYEPTRAMFHPSEAYRAAILGALQLVPRSDT